MIEPLFNAISAPEFRKIVLDSINKAFDNSGEFGSHITFPKVNWNFRLELKVYPSAFPDKIVKDEGEVKKSEPEDSSIYKVINFKQSAGVDTPDLAREQNALPLPTPKIGPDGIIGDVAVMSPREPDPVPVEIEVIEPTAKVNADAVEISGEITPAVKPVQNTKADDVDPAMALAGGNPSGVSDEAREAIYANAPIPRTKARSVEIANKANPDGVKVHPQGGRPVARAK